MRLLRRRGERIPEGVAELIGSGQVSAALQVLEHAGVADPRATAGRIQLRQREESFGSPHGQGATDWPPAVGEPLAPRGEIPEVSGADLDLEALVNGVLGSGSLIVRGLIDEERAGQLRDQIDRAMASRDAQQQSKRGRRGDAWFESYDPERQPFAGPRAVYACDAPRVALEVSAMYQELGVVDLIESYLSERPALSLRKWVLRRVPPGGSTGWHQDGNFLGVDTRNMNLWIGLSDNGVSAPGLDLVPLRFDELVESGTGDADFDWSVGQQQVDRLLGDHEMVRPELRAGDAVFFDHMCLHRTGVSPEMTDTRYAIESWFFAPSHFPSGYRGFQL